jgi:pyruvate formate lyase activating enzyme
VSACPNAAVSAIEEGFETDFSRCEGAGLCAGVCPSGARELCGLKRDVGEVMREILKERIFFEQSGGGVTLTGGEPLSQPDFALELLRECKKEGIGTALDTSGFVSRSLLMDTVPYTDLYLYDVKIMDPKKHREFTGVDNDVILSNLSRLGASGASIWARMPFIPEVNTDETNLRKTGLFLSAVGGVRQLNLLPYHSAAEDKHDRWRMNYKLRGTNPPTEQSLRRAAEIIRGFGVKVVIGG